MAYTTNPRLPQVRYEAYSLVHYKGWSTREVARHLGYAQSTIVKWSNRKPVYGKYGRLVIPTRSSRPHHHPRQLSHELVSRILKIRSERKQCAEIIHHRTSKEGIKVSLSSVKRILKRHGCTRYSKWKKWHQYPARPLPERPGILVEFDSVLEGTTKERLCAYALIDVCSRWAHAAPVARTTTHTSIVFIKEVLCAVPFSLKCVQTDHGSEFSKHFTKLLKHQGLKHRHSRVRKPTDNGYVERFIRTLQDECLHRIPRSYKRWQKEIPEYLHYYNIERPHMGLNFKTPMEVITSY
jgi:transposase InsO family protein